MSIKNQNLFFNIGKESYLKTSLVKAVVDSQTAIGKKLVKEAKETEKEVFNLVSKTEKRLSVVWTFSGDVYLTKYKSRTLVSRLEEKGLKLIKVGPGLYLPVDHIISFFSFGNTTAARVRMEEERKMSFVRKSQKRKTTLLLSDGEVVSVAPEPSKILESIGEVEKSKG